MKTKAVILIIGLFLTSFIYGQSIKKQFNKADEYYENKEYNKALEIFQNIADKKKRHKLYPRALYNVGNIYTILEDTSNARKTFELILTSDFDENEKGGPGKGIMAEPYTLYKHRACKYLADLALENKSYRKALSYMSMADTVYRYSHFCGNAYASNDIYMSSFYADCYIGLGQLDSAIVILLPEVFNNGLANNQIIIDKLVTLLNKKYSQDELKKIFQEAEKSIKIEKEKGEEYNYTYGYIILFEKKIRIPYFDFLSLYETEENKKTDEDWKQKFLETYKNSDIYKEIING